MTTSLTIQQTAAATGLSVHTLRYYERIGLLDPVQRQDNTHRLFREEDLNWIGFLLKLRATGLPIRDMLQYAQLRRQGNTQDSVSARKALLQQHAHSVERTLAELQSNLAVLHQKIVLYEQMEATPTVNVPSEPSLSEDASHEPSQSTFPTAVHSQPAGRPRRRTQARR